MTTPLSSPIKGVSIPEATLTPERTPSFTKAAHLTPSGHHLSPKKSPLRTSIGNMDGAIVQEAIKRLASKSSSNSPQRILEPRTLTFPISEHSITSLSAPSQTPLASYSSIDIKTSIPSSEFSIETPVSFNEMYNLTEEQANQLKEHYGVKFYEKFFDISNEIACLLENLQAQESYLKEVPEETRDRFCRSLEHLVFTAPGAINLDYRFDLTLMLKSLEEMSTCFKNKKTHLEVKTNIDMSDEATAFFKSHNNNVLLEGQNEKLRQIIANVVKNSIKFTRFGKVTVDIKIELVKNEGKDQLKMTFAISDTGIGMTPQGLEKIGKDFSQADSKIQAEFGGTGLGLALSIRSAEEMGGAFYPTTSKHESLHPKDHGTTFSFWVPFKLIPLPYDSTLSAVDKDFVNIRKVINERKMPEPHMFAHHTHEVRTFTTEISVAVNSVVSKPGLSPDIKGALVKIPNLLDQLVYDSTCLLDFSSRIQEKRAFDAQCDNAKAKGEEPPKIQTPVKFTPLSLVDPKNLYEHLQGNGQPIYNLKIQSIFNNEARMLQNYEDRVVCVDKKSVGKEPSVLSMIGSEMAYLTAIRNLGVEALSILEKQNADASLTIAFDLKTHDDQCTLTIGAFHNDQVIKRESPSSEKILEVPVALANIYGELLKVPGAQVDANKLLISIPFSMTREDLSTKPALLEPLSPEETAAPQLPLIAILEDNSTNAMALKMVLKRCIPEGTPTPVVYETCTALKDAIANGSAYHLIFFDSHLHGECGEDLAVLLRQFPTNTAFAENSIFVAHSAAADFETVTRFKNLQVEVHNKMRQVFQRVLSKPAKFLDVKNVINQLMSTKLKPLFPTSTPTSSPTTALENRKQVLLAMAQSGLRKSPRSPVSSPGKTANTLSLTSMRRSQPDLKRKFFEDDDIEATQNLLPPSLRTSPMNRKTLSSQSIPLVEEGLSVRRSLHQEMMAADGLMMESTPASPTLQGHLLMATTHIMEDLSPTVDERDKLTSASRSISNPDLITD